MRHDSAALLNASLACAEIARSESASARSQQPAIAAHTHKHTHSAIAQPAIRNNPLPHSGGFYTRWLGPLEAQFNSEIR